MSSSINSSLSLRLLNDLNRATNSLGTSLQRLTSGKRINSAADGAADLARITMLSSQARGVRAAITSVNDTQGVTTVARSSLDALLTTAYNLRELAQKAVDSSLTSDERDLIVEEAQGLLTDFDNIVNNTEYGSENLLDNSYGTRWAQTGPNADAGFYFTIGDARSSILGQLAIYSGAQGSISAAISGQVTINGTTIDSSSSDGVSTSGAAYSGLAIANAINESTSETGVSAEALSTSRTIYTDFAGAAQYSGTFASNNLTINDVQITGAIASASSLVTAINNNSSTTGVTATLSGTDITLTATDGRNIEIYFSAAANTNNVYDIFNLSTNYSVISAYATLSSGTNTTQVGGIRLWSSSAITISGTTPSLALGISSGTKNLVSGTELSSFSFDTTTEAEQALKTLDATIAQISSLRSNIGAVHDRLDMSASYLLSTAETLEDAKSALEDVDFVLETTNVVMAQLLQNSALAALSQANLSQSQVARLLEDL